MNTFGSLRIFICRQKRSSRIIDEERDDSREILIRVMRNFGDFVRILINSNDSLVSDSLEFIRFSPDRSARNGIKIAPENVHLRSTVINSSM